MMKLNQKIISMLLLILALLVSFSASAEEASSTSSNVSIVPNYPNSENILTLSLSNYYNLQYSGKIGIGSNNKPLDLIFDTGFQHIWIPPEVISKDHVNTTCNPPACYWFDQLPKDEFTYLSIGENVKGHLFSESITFNERKETKFNQSLLVSRPSEFIDPIYADGFCGLSLKSTTQSTPTLVEALHKSKLINKKIFSLYLSDNQEAFGESTSEIIFGGINPIYEKAEFTEINALDSQFWQINLDGFYTSTGNFDSAQVDIKAKTAIIASGINNILMTKQDFSSFLNVLKSSYKLDCSKGLNKELVCSCSDGNIAQFPNLSLKIKEKMFVIPPSMYLQVKENNCVVLIEGTLENSNAYFVKESEQTPSEQKKTKNEESSSSETEGESNSNLIILGGVFLRNFYTVFDAEKRVILFTKVIKPPKSLITALEVVYLIFGSFILVMFIVFVGCFVQICLTKKSTTTEKANLEKTLIERKTTLTQFGQGLENK